MRSSGPAESRQPLSAIVMKLETIKKRLDPKRPMVSITLRMPADLVADLKQIAPAKGMTGYQALIPYLPLPPLAPPSTHYLARSSQSCASPK
jgi:hypothetical protein